MGLQLDIDQLRTFLAIADGGTFTRAADTVHKTQSAVSMQMKKLEETVGRALFERDGRSSRLTEDGARLVDYARRIVRLSAEALASFAEAELAGRVRLGLPDDYADRYLPEILARFSHSNPRVEVTVVCEPTPNLVERIGSADLDLAIITHVDSHGPASVIRRERLLWVTSSRHSVHELNPLPLALGRAFCSWRRAATLGLDSVGRPHRVLYSSWNSTAVGAAVLARARGLCAAGERNSARHADPRALRRLPDAAVLQDRPAAQPHRSLAAGRRARRSYRVESRQHVRQQRAIRRRGRMNSHSGVGRRRHRS